MHFDLESAPSMDDVPPFNFVRFALSNAQRWINRVHHEHQRQSCGWRRTWTATRRWTARSCTASHHRAWSRAKARRSSREDAISCRSWRPRTPPAVASLCTTRAARSRSRSERPGAAYRAGVASERVGARTARGRVASLSSSGIRWQLRVFRMFPTKPEAGATFVQFMYAFRVSVSSLGWHEPRTRPHICVSCTRSASAQRGRLNFSPPRPRPTTTTPARSPCARSRTARRATPRVLWKSAPSSPRASRPRRWGFESPSAPVRAAF